MMLAVSSIFEEGHVVSRRMPSAVIAVGGPLTIVAAVCLAVFLTCEPSPTPSTQAGPLVGAVASAPHTAVARRCSEQRHGHDSSAEGAGPVIFGEVPRTDGRNMRFWTVSASRLCVDHAWRRGR